MATTGKWEDTVPGLLTGTLRGYRIEIRRERGEQIPYAIYIDGVFQARKHARADAQNKAIRLIERDEVIKSQPVPSTEIMAEASGAPSLSDVLHAELRTKLGEDWVRDKHAPLELYACQRNSLIMMVGRRPGRLEWEVWVEGKQIGTAGSRMAAEIKANKAAGWQPATEGSDTEDMSQDTSTTSVTTSTEDTTMNAQAPVTAPTKTYQRIHPKTDFASFKKLLDQACEKFGAPAEDVVEMIGYASPGTAIVTWEREGMVPVTTYWAIVGFLGEGSQPTERPQERAAEPLTRVVETHAFTKDMLIHIIQTHATATVTAQDSEIIVVAAQELGKVTV